MTYKDFEACEKLWGTICAHCGIGVLHRGYWQGKTLLAKNLKGTASSVLISGNKNSDLSVGDRSLVLHIFGGLGGNKGDVAPKIPLTNLQFNAGHFAFGLGKIVIDPFTGQQKLNIEYKKVYAHNAKGIVSGSAKWHSYSGSLQRGWMYTRPLSDVFIKHAAFSNPYQIDGNIVFDPLENVARELEVMTARFRSGDGTSLAQVTTTNSCVQDSNQAMYIAVMKGLEWMRAGNRLSQASVADQQRFAQLEDIMSDYKNNIVQRAGFRQDWRQSMTDSIAVNKEYAGTFESYLDLVQSLKVLVPRWAYDDISVLLFKHGATEFFVRTNQVGGVTPDIYPLAPGFDK